MALPMFMSAGNHLPSSRSPAILIIIVVRRASYISPVDILGTHVGNLETLRETMNMQHQYITFNCMPLKQF